jgi:hypothetical protein
MHELTTRACRVAAGAWRRIATRSATPGSSNSKVRKQEEASEPDSQDARRKQEASLAMDAGEPGVAPIAACRGRMRRLLAARFACEAQAPLRRRCRSSELIWECELGWAETCGAWCIAVYTKSPRVEVPWRLSPTQEACLAQMAEWRTTQDTLGCQGGECLCLCLEGG